MYLHLYDGIVFDFTSAMRIHDTGKSFAKSAGSEKSGKEEDPWPGLQLKIKHGDFENLTTIVYNDVYDCRYRPRLRCRTLQFRSRSGDIYKTALMMRMYNSMTRQALPLAGSEDSSYSCWHLL